MDANGTLTILEGDCVSQLRTLPAESVQCCVTSPPYYGLRDYGVKGQIGLEKTWQAYVRKLVRVFREVRRVLKDDGVLWLNLGDTYAGGGNGGGGSFACDGCRAAKPGTDKNVPARTGARGVTSKSKRIERGAGRWGGGNVPATGGMKGKDLMGIPWRVAFALQEDGWYLRCDVVWNKPNPMPEGVTDRPTRAHEYLFLLAKSPKYFYDGKAIAEPVVGRPEASRNRWDMKDYEVPGQKPQKRTERARGNRKTFRGGGAYTNGHGFLNHEEKPEHVPGNEPNASGLRNKRSVWTVATSPYAQAHFATFPPALVRPCVLAGSRPGDVVVDPFGGSGTTGMVALQEGRRAVLIELNPAYVGLMRRRTDVTPGLGLVADVCE